VADARVRDELDHPATSALDQARAQASLALGLEEFGREMLAGYLERQAALILRLSYGLPLHLPVVAVACLFGS
jgi:hypothetical protein